MPRLTEVARRAAPAAAFALVAVGVAGAFQLAFARIPSDADTAYHAAVGGLLRRHGILTAFPWTPMSWLADRYADKELLFHLLYVPLDGLGWVTASHAVGAICGAALLTSLFLVLRAEGVRLAAAWALLPLLASSAFLYRFVLVRPHLLSIALSIAVLWAASRRRLAVLAACALVYPWAYVAWFLPLLLVAVAEVARLSARERPDWRPAAVAAAGLAAGVALHPNGGNVVRFMALVIADVLVKNAWGGAQGLEMGTEFEPFSAGDWASLLLLAAAMSAAALPLAWRARRTSSTPLAFALAAVAFGLATARTARFAEYFVPVSVAALALALRAVERPLARLAPAALGAVALLYQGREEAALLTRLRDWPSPLPGFVGRAMASAIPPGAQVFTCEWGLTGHLMLALPERKFLVALDPGLFRAKDPELYGLWYAMTRRPPPGVAAVIRERFGARFVACTADAQFEAFVARLAAEPGVRTVLTTETWNVLDLGGGAP